MNKQAQLAQILKPLRVVLRKQARGLAGRHVRAKLQEILSRPENEDRGFAEFDIELPDKAKFWGPGSASVRFKIREALGRLDREGFPDEAAFLKDALSELSRPIGSRRERRLYRDMLKVLGFKNPGDYGEEKPAEAPPPQDSAPTTLSPQKPSPGVWTLYAPRLRAIEPGKPFKAGALGDGMDEKTRLGFLKYAVVQGWVTREGNFYKRTGIGIPDYS